MDTKLPSPYMLMKRSKRILDFDDEGRPLHPLKGKLLNINGKQGKGTLPRWAANFAADALVIGHSGEIVASASAFIKSGESPTVCALRALRKTDPALAALLKNTPCKIVYDNMDNFDARTTENAWVETSVCMWKLDAAHSRNHSKNDKTHNPLHDIIIHQFSSSKDARASLVRSNLRSSSSISNA